MLFALLSFLLAGFLPTIAAQDNSYPYTIAPNDPSVSPQQRNSWCLAQQNSCKQICGGNAPTNRCDGQQLTYTCTCGDGTSPNVTQYDQTLPFFECQIYREQCIARNPADAQAQQACNQVPCGGKSPEAAQSSASAASASTMSTSAASSTGDQASSTQAAASASSSAPSRAAVRLSFDPYLSIGALVAGFMLLGGVAL